MPVFSTQQLADMEPDIKKAMEASVEKMIYALLVFDNEVAMLRTADILLTHEAELAHACSELYQLGYESKMESGDDTPDEKITKLYEFCEAKYNEL